MSIDNYHDLQTVLLWSSTKYSLLQSTNVSPTDAADRSASVSTTSFAHDRFDAHSNPLISWQSAYRFAHLFELTALESLALAEFAELVSVETVAGDLFGKLSARHSDVREIAMEYAVNHWAEVRKSAEWKKVQILMEEGKVEGGGVIAMELAARL